MVYRSVASRYAGLTSEHLFGIFGLFIRFPEVGYDN